ncbi:MAG: hypothetical protein INR64_16385, partial [Caulobacteraceae bacterium]|nr:hypothetical protein [Caulobacter sp.]
MDRISTAGSYSAILAGISSAQSRMATAQSQISSGELATDLKGYAPTADALTAAKTVKARLDSYADSGSALSDRLSAQAQALDGVSQASTSARQAVFKALADGSGSTVMQELQGWLGQASDALNTNYQGQYLFSGGQSNTPPVKQPLDVSSLPPSPFQDGDLKSVSRLDDNLTIQTGQLASDVGSKLYAAFQNLSQYVTSHYPATKQLPDPLTTDDITQLQSSLGDFDAAQAVVSDAVSQNGVNQNRVAAAQARITDQQSAATSAISNMADADPAKAATDLQLAQTALQASAQVFQTLK